MPLGPPELLLILLLVLIIFGAGKLPQVFRSLGSGVKEFREASEGRSADAPAQDAANTGTSTATTTTTTAAPLTTVGPNPTVGTSVGAVGGPPAVTAADIAAPPSDADTKRET
jgi:sec-independent protein translocase protein TatA